jgi:predicted MFS family arabinose efflux permease
MNIGGVLYPIILHQLIPRLGFGWATRVLALITLVTLTVPVAVMRMRVVPKARRALVDLSAFRDAPFVLFTVGCFFIFMGLYIPMFYVQSFAIEEGITSENLAFYMLSIINAASVFGRLVPNFIADTVGPLNVLIPCTIVAALLAFCWLAVKNTAGLIVFCLLYGFFTGGLVSLPPTVLVSLSPSMAVVGSRMGTCFAFNGISLLVGTPIAGALVKPGDFKGAIAFCGSVDIFGCIFLILARIVKVGTALRAKI